MNHWLQLTLLQSLSGLVVLIWICKSLIAAAMDILTILSSPLSYPLTILTILAENMHLMNLTISVENLYKILTISVENFYKIIVNSILAQYFQGLP
jgi:hypothetical protein